MRQNGSVPDLIALAMPGGPKFVDELKRAWDNGDAVLPVDVRLPPESLGLLLKSMGAAAIVGADGERTTLAYSRATEAGDALVIATSGSTGEPKGVVHTHQSVMASAEITSARLGVTSDDHWLACLPLSHIGGLSVITKAIHRNTALTVLPRFDADKVMAAARDGANFVSLVPTALGRVDASIFKTILLGGSGAPDSRPSNTILTYGSTETGSGIVYEREPLDGVELSIDDAGQLLVKSPTLLRCYRDDTDPRRPDGWFPTGDAATIDASGVLQVFGRIAEVINTGGEKVWPSVVENALKSHPAICEALIYGEPDKDWGQRVVASVELADGAFPPTLRILRDHIKTTLPAYCAPKELRITTKLARTGSGKVDRRESSRN